MASPVPRLSVPDQVFEQLREPILSGVYGPGERLPPRRGLAAEMEVNMASVREALQRLEQLRLVEVRHGDATRALDWRRSGGLEALLLGGAAEEPFLRDLFEARRLLLVEAARLAAQRRTEEQARQLRELGEAVAAAAETGVRLAADWAFMAALVEAAHNLVFQLIMNSVRELYLQRAEDFTALVAAGESRPGLYRRAASAVAARDAEGASRAIGELASAQAASMLG